MGYLTITDLGLGNLQWADVEQWLSLDSLKAHLIVEHDEDDYLIRDYAVSAWNIVETTIERPLKELAKAYKGMPASITHAVRLLVGRYYAERESESYTNRRELSFGISALLMPYKAIAKVAEADAERPKGKIELKAGSDIYDRLAPILEALECGIDDVTLDVLTHCHTLEYFKEAVSDPYVEVDEYLRQYWKLYLEEEGFGSIYYPIDKYLDHLMGAVKVVLSLSDDEYKRFDVFNAVSNMCLGVSSSLKKIYEDKVMDPKRMFTYGSNLSFILDKVKEWKIKQVGRPEQVEEQFKYFVANVVAPYRVYFDYLCRYDFAWVTYGLSDDVLYAYGSKATGSIVYNVLFYLWTSAGYAI